MSAAEPRPDLPDDARPLVADAPGILDALAADAALGEVMHVGAADADAGYLNEDVVRTC